MKSAARLFFGHNHQVKLQRVALLYIVAGCSSLLWFVALFEYRESVWLFVEMNLFYLGYLAVVIWFCMAAAALYLMYIGMRIRKLVSGDVHITQSAWQLHTLQSVIRLLLVGIAADVVAIPLLMYMENTDGFMVIFASVMMGGRVLQVNMMAIEHYHQL